MLTISLLLVLAAFVITLSAALTPPKAHLWVAVLLLVLLEAFKLVPLR